MKTARQISVEGLLKVNTEGAYSQIALNKLLSSSEIAEQEKAFATRLFYGAIEKKLTLDYYLKPYVKHKLKPVVLEILRISIYQLVYMPSVPESAVVNEAVKLTRKLKQPGAAGLVNGVLRSFIREGKKELPNTNKPSDLEIKYSIPKDLTSLFMSWYGEETTLKMLSSTNETPKAYVRVNTLKTNADELIKNTDFLKRTDLENCLEAELSKALQSKYHKDGHYYVQDYSSQFAISKLSPKKGDRVLDLCAAPGSKSFTSAMYNEDSAEIVSSDIHQHKIELMKDGANKLGIKSINAILSDATIFNQALGKFDKVICDVPCSGLGIIRKKVEIKYKDVKEFGALPKLQYEILKNAIRYLKDDGSLLYSTCTINPKENDEVVEMFLREHSDYELLFKRTMLFGVDDYDGFFVAIIKKK